MDAWPAAGDGRGRSARAIPREHKMISTGDFKMWQCHSCGYTDDEAAGDPDEGGRTCHRWADLPAD